MKFIHKLSVAVVAVAFVLAVSIASISIDLSAKSLHEHWHLMAEIGIATKGYLCFFLFPFDFFFITNVDGKISLEQINVKFFLLLSFSRGICPLSLLSSRGNR